MTRISLDENFVKGYLGYMNLWLLSKGIYTTTLFQPLDKLVHTLYKYKVAIGHETNTAPYLYNYCN